MRYIDRINTSPSQQLNLISEDGDAISMLLRFLPTQGVWVADFELGSFQLKGIILVCSPNILRQFKNNISFGIAITSEDGLDPCFINDFSTGRIKLFLLNGAEVSIMEEVVFDA